MTGATLANGGAAARATIQELRVLSFIPTKDPNTYALKFPSGRGQSYVVEASSTLGEDTTWTPLSGLVGGTGSDITLLQYCEDPACFLRVKVESTPPSQP